MINVIRLSEHCEGRVLFRYRNIICLISDLIIDDVKTVELNFYDIYKKKLVDIYDWNKKLSLLKIIDISYLKSSIFIASVYQEKTFLICLDLHNYTWQECLLSQHVLNYDEVSLQNDGIKMYIGNHINDTSYWEYNEVVRIGNILCLKPLNFLQGYIKELKIYNSCIGNSVFRCFGYEIKIFSDDHNLQYEFLNFNTLFTYSGTNAHIIVTESEGSQIECVTVCNNRIYYQITQNDQEKLFCYDPIEKCIINIHNKQTEHIEPSYENDFFIYTDMYIIRVSDNKKVFISEIMDSIKKCNADLLSQVSPFPDCWYFYDNWLVAELDGCQSFVVNLNSMKSYYFENTIDIDMDSIYLYELPFYYMK